jgi:hypothetical protein
MTSNSPDNRIEKCANPVVKDGPDTEREGFDQDTEGWLGVRTEDGKLVLEVWASNPLIVRVVKGGVEVLRTNLLEYVIQSRCRAS